MSAPTAQLPQARRWTIDEYHDMADRGYFRDQRVELIDGEIIDMAAQRDVHAAVVSLTQRALAVAFGQGFWVRSQLPLRLGARSEPEPDVSVVPGNERNYIGTGHPTSALLVVEVSDTSLIYDRTDKASLYAAHGIREYWIVNLQACVLEVGRDPIPDSACRFGHRYGTTRTLSAAESIKPPAAAAEVSVADLLP